MVILIVLYIFLCVWLLLPRKSEIPKIIWSFWDGYEQPPIVKACIDSWKRMAPDYEIRILDKNSTKDIEKYALANESLQRYSDFVRLDRLSNYGGVWIDASVYLTKPLDWIQNGSDFVGYKSTSQQVDSSLPVIDSWFFACKQESGYVKDWYEEMKKIKSVKDYLKSVTVDYSKIHGPEYLTIHVTSMQVRANKRYSEKFTLIDSETDAGKFMYGEPIENFCSGKVDQNLRMVKFSQTVRNSIPPDCGVLKNFI
jgi:mannosyltransferase OCH1-like enzyme